MTPIERWVWLRGKAHWDAYYAAICKSESVVEILEKCVAPVEAWIDENPPPLNTHEDVAELIDELAGRMEDHAQEQARRSALLDAEWVRLKERVAAVFPEDSESVWPTTFPRGTAGMSGVAPAVRTRGDS
jgi:hypothetical protein